MFYAAIETLSPQGREVIQLALDGLKNSEIAARLGIASIFIRLLAPKKCTKENLSVFSDAAPVIILHSPHIPYNKLLTTSSIYRQNRQQVTLSMKAVSLKDVLWAIERQTSFVFMYNEEDLDKIGKVDVEVQGDDIRRF